MLLLLADRGSRQTREVEDLNRRDAAIIGVAQACALIPGVSRSGATLTAGLFLGLTAPRPPATRSCCPCRPSCSAASTS